MKRTINREYELSAEEVRTALFYYLANHKDLPIPKEFDDAKIAFVDGAVSIFFDEFAEV